MWGNTLVQQITAFGFTTDKFLIAIIAILLSENMV